MNLVDLYYWELELSTGEVHRQYDKNGHVYSWKDIEKLDLVVRASMIPKLNGLPRHDVFIDISKGEKFIKKFGRGFIKQGNDGFKLRQYLHCIETNKYRLWVFPDGKTLTTRPDYEVML
jgi:hypothetical protein